MLAHRSCPTAPRSERVHIRPSVPHSPHSTNFHQSRTLLPNFTQKPLTAALKFLKSDASHEHRSRALCNIKVILAKGLDSVTKKDVDQAIKFKEPAAARMLFQFADSDVKALYELREGEVVKRTKLEEKMLDPLSRILLMAKTRKADAKGGEVDYSDLHKMSVKFLTKLESCVTEDHLDEAGAIDPILALECYKYANQRLKEKYLLRLQGDPNKVLSKLDPRSLNPVNLMAK